MEVDEGSMLPNERLSRIEGTEDLVEVLLKAVEDMSESSELSRDGLCEGLESREVC
jgi:hypothetical protein